MLFVKITILSLCLARGNVEEWLGKVEEAMVVTLKKISKSAIIDFFKTPRDNWLVSHPSQVKLVNFFAIRQYRSMDRNFVTETVNLGFDSPFSQMNSLQLFLKTERSITCPFLAA